MLKGAVARRYAEAVFELGSEPGKPDTLDSWLNDVKTIADYFSNHSLAFILGEPNVRFDRKEAIVRDLLTDKVRPEALGLALAMVESSIVALAPRVRDEFERLYNDYRGTAVAYVTSAMALDDAARASIIRQMEQLTGKRIPAENLRESVDPSLLGGATVRVGDTLIDGSVRRRLELLRRRIEEGGDLGGSMDGLDDLIGSNGQSGDGATPPPANPGSPAGPASATSAAPRDPEAPRMAPRQPGNPNNPNNSNTKRGKRRGR